MSTTETDFTGLTPTAGVWTAGIPEITEHLKRFEIKNQIHSGMGVPRPATEKLPDYKTSSFINSSPFPLISLFPLALCASAQKMTLSASTSRRDGVSLRQRNEDYEKRTALRLEIGCAGPGFVPKPFDDHSGVKTRRVSYNMVPQKSKKAL